MDNSLEKPKKPGLREEIRKEAHEIKKQMFTLLIGGLGLVAALAWNDAIRALFSRIFPQGEDLFYKFGYAVVVTAIVVFLSLRLKKIVEEHTE